MRMKLLSSLFVISSLLISTANADELPRLLLGKGLVSTVSAWKEMKFINREMHKSGLQGYTREQMHEFRHKTYRQFIGLECVGKDSEGNPNCFKVQPVAINLDTKVVMRRGNVLPIGNFQSKELVGEPSDREKKEFLKSMEQAYLKSLIRNQGGGQKTLSYMIDGLAVSIFVSGLVVTGGASAAVTAPVLVGFMAGDYAFATILSKLNLNYVRHFEMIDASGWNWASEPREVTRKVLNGFERFIFEYKISLPLNSEEMQQVIDGNPAEAWEEALKNAREAKAKRIAEAPYPVIPLKN